MIAQHARLGLLGGTGSRYPAIKLTEPVGTLSILATTNIVDSASLVMPGVDFAWADVRRGHLLALRADTFLAAARLGALGTHIGLAYAACLFRVGSTSVGCCAGVLLGTSAVCSIAVSI